MVDSSSGAACPAATKAAITAGVAGRTSIPPTIWSRGCRRNRNSGGDAEVAAAAADRPKQLRMGLVVDVQQLAVGGHHLGGQQAVDGQAVLSDQVPDAAAEGVPPIPTEAVSPNPVARP
jgi:hypothetical protein